MAKGIAKFMYENIIIKFGYPTHFIGNHGHHFINKTIEMLVEKFIITQHKLTLMQDPQGNKQAQSTNKTLGKILVELVNANWTYLDIMLFTTIWTY